MKFLIEYIALTIISFFFLPVNAQESDERVQISFLSHPQQRYGLDSPQEHSWNIMYESFYNEDSIITHIPFKSVGYLEKDVVLVRLTGINRRGTVKFKIKNTSKTLEHNFLNDSTIALSLPALKEDFYIDALYKRSVYSRLHVKVYKEKIHDIYIVSTTDNLPQIDSVSHYLNNIYKQANIRFHVIDGIKFNPKTKLINNRLSNPLASRDRYTAEMRSIRDEFFESYPNLYKNAQIVFIVPGFTNPDIHGFMVDNKAMAFVEDQEDSLLFLAIARELSMGIGMLGENWKEQDKGNDGTDNLLDTLGGTNLTYFQWQWMRHATGAHSFYDADEDLKTNNGLVGYYFWEIDKDGNLICEDNSLLSAVKRPYKKNYLSHHLNIQDFMFETVYEWEDIAILWWHIAGWILLLIISWILLRKLKFRAKTRPRPFLIRITIRWTVRWVIIFSGVGIYYFVNDQLDRYEVKSGYIAELDGLQYDEAKKNILNNEELRYRNQKSLMSEIFIQKDNKWNMKKHKAVLYFSAKYDTVSHQNKFRFVTSKDSLLIRSKDYRSIAKSHYIVCSYYSVEGQLTEQKVFNHLGVEISKLLDVQDATKRILLFVNGYRPTSVGHTFEENFNDILSNGLEYKNTSNHIYSFDRYNYWRPWNEIDLQFIQRLNPTETYYADGHHSVATSNHESVYSFTKTSSYFPKRCKNPENHTCRYYISNNESIDLLPTRPNRRGFRKRVKNGEIAGKNLDLIFNEIPNHSENDTLYIVAHSMGYAYALGIIEQLRGKINFGGMYIIAPENASAGSVNISEWKEIWQYGANLDDKAHLTPCLQDGIAPQAKCGGLKNDQRVYIPEEFYKRQGFYDSHFIGYYSWIFDIKKEEKGYIRQR